MSLHLTAHLLQQKEGIDRYAELLEDKEVDVLFFGNSHMFDAVYPMELWEEYGITSFNCACGGNRIPTSYWIVKSVLEVKKPKLVVIDIYGIENPTKVKPGREGVSYLHVQTDWMGLRRNKIRMAKDLYDGDISTMLEFAFPFALYHSRWDDLSMADFTLSYDNHDTYKRGSQLLVGYSKPAEFSLIPKEEAADPADMIGYTYLDFLISECQEQGIEVLPIMLPYPASEDEQKASNTVYKLADKYGINYLNMLYEPTGINFETDCYDANSHLNPSGGRKATSYLGQYILDNYDVTSHKTEAEYAFWDEYYEKYTGYKYSSLKAAHSDIYSYMAFLYDKDITVDMYIPEDSVYSNDQVFEGMMNNLDQSRLNIVSGDNDSRELYDKAGTYLSEQGITIDDFDEQDILIIVYDKNVEIIDVYAKEQE